MSTTSVSVTESTTNVVVPSVTDTTATTASLSLTQTGGKKKTTKKTAKATKTKKTTKKTTKKATKKGADGQPKIKTVGSRREVWEGKAKRTSGHLTKADLILNSAGRPVSKAQHEKGLKQYDVLKPWRDHLDAFRKEHPEMSLKEQMKAASKTYKKTKAKKTVKKTGAKKKKSAGKKTKGKKTKVKKTPTKK
jgi:hypothetical protein